MSGRAPIRRWVLIAAGWAALAGPPATPAWAGEVFDADALGFAAAIDLDRWGLLVVQQAGRAKILDTVARRQLNLFYGRRSIEGTPPTFALLELYFNAGAYLSRPVIRLRDARLREGLKPHMSPPAAEMLARTARLAPMDLLNRRAELLLLNAGRASEAQVDRRRAGSLVGPCHALAQADVAAYDQVRRLLGRMEAFLAVDLLCIFPPDEPGAAFLTPEELARLAAAGSGAPPIAAAAAADLNALFGALAQAWRRRDAALTNALSARLLDRLAARAGRAWPAERRRRLERLHNRLMGFTIAWVGFFAAALLLLGALAARRRRRWLLPAGMALFVLSTLLLAGGVVVRWIISGRGWRLPPLTNQYESVLGAALMAAATGCALELIFKRGTLALAASVFAAAALLSAFFQVGPLDAGIDAPMAVLNTAILGWHVATLMVGYGIIGMSLVVSVAYLAIALAVAGRRKAAPRPPPSGGDPGGRTTPPGDLLAELDRYNVILLQLACCLIAIGDALGAYWGDRAWGRWWGWDVKETWGLMTLLVYLIIIHLRYVLPRRSRGAWTAGLAVFGCAVMGFTWWGVNYLLRGLHSYA